jgi:hypothetical protein
MTLFLLSIWCVVCEFIDAVYSIRQLSLSFHWRFQGLQLLCFHRRFMDHPWHSVFDNSMCMPWLYFSYRVDASVMNSFTLSIPYVGSHSVIHWRFQGVQLLCFPSDLWISCDIAFFTIPWVCHDSIFVIDLMCREFIDTVDFVRQLSLSVHWRFWVLRWLCFRWRFMDQPWHSVFDNSMRQPWLYFCYRFDAPFVNSVTLSIPYVRCPSVLRFQGLQLLCFRRRFMDQLWHSMFYNSMCLPWLYFCNRFDASFVNSLTMSIPYIGCHSVFIVDFKVYSDSVFADDLWISCNIAFLTIPCVNHDSIFAIDLMSHSWIHWRCRFCTSAVTQYSLMISSSTVTLFSLMIYGSVLT